MVLIRLAISNFTTRKVRTSLTVAAIALSASLVVAVTSGYKSIQGSALRFLNQYMSAADAIIMPGSDRQRLVPESLVKDLAADPGVREVVGRLETVRELQRAPDQVKQMKNPDLVAAGAVPPDKVMVVLVGIRRPDDSKSDSLELSDGRWFDSATGNFAVIDQQASEKLGVTIGNSLVLPGFKDTLPLLIVGEVHKPTFFAQRAPTVYVPIETLQHFTEEPGTPAQVSRISINLRANSSFDDFKQRWTARLAMEDPTLRLRMRRENAGDLEKNLRGIHIMTYMGGAVCMLTAMFIIFSALSMGVTERQRVLAMLRAVGAARGQIFRLVLFEGLVLSAAGVAIGVPLGMAWMELLYLRFPDFFAAGALFSIGGMIYAAAGSMLTALAAGLLPGWWASRISPLEAMATAVSPPMHRPPIGWAILGLLLIAIDPLLFFGPVEPLMRSLGAQDPRNAAESVRFFGHFAAGLPGIMLGFFLLGPTVVWLVERLLAPALAAGFAIPMKLLRQQLSTGMWRAAGTAAALMVGLATLVAMQTNGHTLIGGWKLPTEFPDIFIWAPDPISWKDQATLSQVPGIEPGSLLPVVVTTQAGDSKTALFLATALSGQNVGFMFFAVEPDQALRMIQLDFRDDQGGSLPRDQQTAYGQKVLAELKKGRRIIVTDEFRESRNVKVGDTIPIQTTLNGLQNYTICAIVWSPGVDVIISMFDLGRVLDQQTAGSVFGTIDDAKRDFGTNGARLFAANLQGGIDKDVLLKNVQKSLGDRGLAAGDVRHIKYAIEHAFYQLLDLISTIAIAAMAVASLGVANTIMASIRSRRWQFGILRGIGLQRGDLLRIILAEATLLGIVGILLGVAAGLEIAVDDRQFSGAFLGYRPDLQIPWHIVAGGSLALLAVAIVAGLWPAISVARAQPLDLLQAGRAST